MEIVTRRRVRGRDLSLPPAKRCRESLVRAKKSDSSNLKPLKDKNKPQTDEDTRSPYKVSLCFQDVKEAVKSLHCALPSNLYCRDKELATISCFLKTTLEANTSGSLYISGPPGTGKTACVTHVLQSYKCSTIPFITVNINCMSIQKPQAVFTQIFKEAFGVSETAGNLTDCIVSSKKTLLIVLDEIDQLVQRGQEVLYTLFEWPSLPGSKVVLIGIANSLNFTDRLLPRLQTHLKDSYHPQLLHFLPYTKDELVLILQQRLGSSGIVDPKAIEFCARKVSAVFGDLRKALDICRRAVELSQVQEVSQRFRHSEGTSENCSALLVTVKEVAAVIADDSMTLLKEDSLPLQQKLVICSLVVLARSRSSKEISLAQLHEGYRSICERQKIRSESESELVALCGFLESRGIIAIRGKINEPRLLKIRLKLQDSEVENILRDKALLSSILTETL